MSIAVLAAAAGTSPQQAGEFWRWQQPASLVEPISLELVRADVTIVPADGDVVSVKVAGGGQPRPSVEVQPTAAGSLIFEVYPRTEPNGWGVMRECYPATRHGALWLSSLPLTVTVSAPPGARVDVRVMEGEVRDLRTMGDVRP